jgi:D-serine deaminase-like pyridoxal phosphate-dependent protein
VTIGRILEEGGASLRGVMTHAGESYSARSIAELEGFAEQERLAVVTAAQHLRASGLPCPVISVGSTPTAHFARNLDGVTEVRAGVFTFFDLVMAGIGVCTLDDLALSVLTTVIGHQADKGWVLCDAGWMALSRDRGTQGQAVDQGYGVVCDADGRPYDNLIVEAANQEHGIIALRPGSVEPLPDLPVGTVLRILPNHACATGAQFDAYTVLPADGGPLAVWPRFRGW